MHCELHFPQTYPNDPPNVKLFTQLSHPSLKLFSLTLSNAFLCCISIDVFHNYNFAAHGEFENTRSAEGYWICLDLLKSFVTEAYTGWSTAYTAFSILLQIQSFLFQLAYTTGNYPTQVKEAAKAFQYVLIHCTIL